MRSRSRRPTGAACLLAPLLLAVFAPVPAAGAELRGLLAELEMVALGSQTPPPFSLARLDGGRVALSELKGQVVLLYFWATW